MSAISINTNDPGRSLRFLESVAYTNVQTDITKAIRVPDKARFAAFYLFITSQGGTTPQGALLLNVPDFSTASKMAAPDDGNVIPLGGAAITTPATGTGPYVHVVQVGPGLTGIADDIALAAAADAYASINAVLPPWIAYTLDFGADADEDYALELLVQFRQ